MSFHIFWVFLLLQLCRGQRSPADDVAIQDHQHGGWDEDAGFSALYLKLPERNLTFIVLANSEGIWWGNPLDKALVEGSSFARLFLNHFVFKTNKPPFLKT